MTVAVCAVRLGTPDPPVRLVAGTRDTVVVNAIRPVRVPLRILDAAGRTLSDTGVRFAHRAGAPITLSPRGVVTCNQAGDAVVRASLGTLATDVQVRCRPVDQLLAAERTDFVLGDPAREIALESSGPTAMLEAEGAVMRIPALRPGILDTRGLVRAPGAWMTITDAWPSRATPARPALVGTLAPNRDEVP